MKMKFEVTIETDEASAYDIAWALLDQLRVLHMPNGDTLFIDDPQIEHKPE